ncbi:disease resistance protein RPM1-like [Phragmites australis]|uniref:disease resistance protein RPM1-like n=1 Tax=Phragmites australis TaxID=29695 RepID=UPI002D789C7A|nr:disease resistance protein RPM1-like [Phragmites australis]XP_062229698.1 disease resistance protein RPM1-like [Phragmites australis]
MADSLFVVLRKVALSLGERALERIGTEVVEAAPILTDFEHSMKQIEGEFSILQAFIGQVSAEKVGDKAFDAWLDQVRDVAHEVEDIIDEHAYLTAQAVVDTGSFFKRKFLQIKNFVAWQKFPNQISQVEARIQRLAEMRHRYGISIGELDRRNKLQHSNQLPMPDSAYLTDSSDIVGNVDEIGRLTQWLLEEKQDRTLITIFGMGGLGKTTVASSIYKSQKIRRAFDCHAWVTVSQTYQVEELLREIMNQLVDQRASIASSFMNMSRMRLVEVIQSCLQDKKYLIVLDDVWDKDAWLFLNSAFVRNSFGGRVLMTTRRKDVSSLAAGNYIIELKTLKCAESWELFCKKAFPASKDNICPENLRSWAEKIVAKCQGLPLAIVTIGSILSYRELEEQEWTFFYNQLSWQLANNPELNWISNVLNLSLNDLPSYLRSCFLYCSLYPEDYKIKRKAISKLWIAEGLVEERGDGTTMEEVAQCYLTELTQRSLLLVTERNACGRARTFLMHDLVQEVTSIIAKKEKVGVSYGDAGITQVAHEARRLSIQKGAQSLKSLAGSRLRSFILFDTEVPSSWIYDVLSRFRLLRVLCLRFSNIEQVPGVVTELYNLRYLDFSYTKVKQIPASFRKLAKLQVLDLRFSYVEELPLEITMLTNLRHLHVLVIHDLQERSLNCFGATKIPGNICHLKNLQALQIVSASKGLVSQLGSLTLMRSLAINKVRQSYIEELWNSLTKMPNLSRLVISACDMDEVLDLKMLKPLPNLKFFRLAGKLEAGVLPSIFSKFEKLAWLKMDWSGLKKDPIISFSHMLNLVDLRLYGAYGGEQLSFCVGWFPKLELLTLAHMERLSWIEIEDGTMMGLDHLELVGLGNLKVVPEGIKHIRTLHQMYLKDMPNGFIQSLQGSGSHIVKHIPSIHMFESSDSQAVNNLQFVPYLAKKFGPGATEHAPMYWGSSGT